MLGATPAPRRAVQYGPAPNNAQTAVVKKYVDALRAGRYDSAFALLTDDERKYFGDAASYRSVFTADGVVLRRASVVGARGDDRGRVYFVRERIAYVDHATDKRPRGRRDRTARRAARARQRCTSRIPANRIARSRRRRRPTPRGCG